MIRREARDHDVLITQDDHAALSGQLVQHWGNARFHHDETPAAPWTAVLLAASLHDAGWAIHDNHPTLNAHGRPLDLFETPLPLSLRAWGASADLAAVADPYAGLLTSLHVLMLSADAPVQAAAQSSPAMLFALNKFQHREIERQEELRRSIRLVATMPLSLGLAPPGSSATEDLLRFHLRILQAADAISLGLCCTQPPARQTRPVHASPGQPPTMLEMARDSDGVIRVDLWPFDGPSLHVTVPARSLPAQQWESQAAFQTACASAAFELLRLTVRSM
jgi:hypothetical protein